ncbi:hypothetical protein BU15DRAFT_62208 [Melanogaster broomeanus]|nr:hypothetical protein BU15DRAFT_62208 [Melanogaster broomeanus]
MAKIIHRAFITGREGQGTSTGSHGSPPLRLKGRQSEPDAEDGVAGIIAQLVRLRIGGVDDEGDEEEQRQDLHNSVEMRILLDGFSLPRRSHHRNRRRRVWGRRSRKKSPELGLSAAGTPRRTRKDIARLPKSVFKIYTPEELEDLFDDDDDDYLTPFVQSTKESQLAEQLLCLVWKKPAPARCAQCKVVRIERNPRVREGNGSWTEYATPWSQIRKYGTVEELMQTWAGACVVGATSLGRYPSRNAHVLFVVLREPDTANPQRDGSQTETHRAVKEGEIQPSTRMSSKFTTVPLLEVDPTQLTPTELQTRRGSEVTLRSSYCEVTQFEPDSLREADEMVHPDFVHMFGGPVVAQA